MPRVVAASSIFPEPEQWPPVRTSETKAQFVAYERPMTVPQPYRGAGPAVAQSQPLPIQSTGPSPLMAQLQALSARLTTLQRQLDDSNSAGGISQTVLDQMRAQLASLEGSVVPAATAGPKSFASFSSYAAEASRIRNSGRLPFASDHQKMMLG